MKRDGYNGFRNRLKGYKNKENFGIRIGRLASVKPVTIEVEIEGALESFPFDDFFSLISFENVKETDIGTEYTVLFTGDNQGIWVLGEAPERYSKYYPRAE